MQMLQWSPSQKADRFEGTGKNACARVLNAGQAGVRLATSWRSAPPILTKPWWALLRQVNGYIGTAANG
ncbi:hypothetical protein [Pseudomonas typographi]|uniref:hypothetical protein n=1 Tax=Pseudomonas typographi TaxID=2715964 RepID=UPI001684FB9B|nr:hypothetical protein [Pseudomonas typographi]MBD1551405.1 hypothetical protein [Pseudomonas typographi]MBD1586459.1 hypothetical protein [Pseudomonas typographi]